MPNVGDLFQMTHFLQYNATSRGTIASFIFITAILLIFASYVSISTSSGRIPLYSRVETIVRAGTVFTVAGSADHAGGHHAIGFTINSTAFLTGSYNSYVVGQYPNGSFSYTPTAAAIYVMTDLQFSKFNGTGLLNQYVVPTDYVYSTGFAASGSFEWKISSGFYYLWIQGEGENLPIPLEFTQHVNFTSDLAS